MGKIIKYVLLAIVCFISTNLFAQSSPFPAPAGFMLSEGKIYVVVLVVLVILSGLFIYLINLDRKISNLEKE